MVSSYCIMTNISVPKQYIKRFNKYSDSLIPSSLDDSIKVKSYYDAGYYPGGTETLDRYLRGELCDPFEPINVFGNSWKAHEVVGQLYDNCEKFHGAVRILDYMIANFFEPNGIVLNGLVIGVNMEYNHLYIYNVIDNKIKLEEELTRKYTKIHEVILNEQGSSDEVPVWEKMMNQITSDFTRHYSW